MIATRSTAKRLSLSTWDASFYFAAVQEKMVSIQSRNNQLTSGWKHE
jgi:hypothetical protein